MSNKILVGMAIGNMLVPGPDRSIPAWNEAKRQSDRANFAEDGFMAVAGLVQKKDDDLALANRQVRDLVHHGIARESVMLSLHEALAKADPSNHLVQEDPRAKARELLERVFEIEQLPDEYLDLVDQIMAEGKVEAAKRLVQIKEMDDAILKREAMKDPDFQRVHAMTDAEFNVLAKKFDAEFDAGKIEGYPALIIFEGDRRAAARKAAKASSNQPKN